jgi:PAS domain S-box-containing protein
MSYSFEQGTPKAGKATVKTEFSSTDPFFSTHTWRTLQVLYGQLLEAPDLPAICSTALQFFLLETGRRGGIILVQKPEEVTPYLTVQWELPDEWSAHIQSQESELHRLAGQVLHSGEPFVPAPRESDSTTPDDLAAILPIQVPSGVQGAMILQGNPCSLQEIHQLMFLAGPVGQALHSRRAMLSDIEPAQKLAPLQALLQSRNTLRALFDSMPAALYIVDRQHKLIAINISCAQRSSKSPKQLVGRLCYQALYQREEPCPECRIGETFSNLRNTTRSGQRMDDSGEVTEWEISTFPILDEKEQVVQVILLEQDVTEKRHLERIIAQSEKLAAVGQLAAGVAHEINNPLAAIVANAQILQRQIPAEDELQESIDLIARAGERAAQVVHNLLDFARKEQYRLTPTDINASIQRSIALIQHELLNRSIQVVFGPGEDLPLILASQDHLFGVWINLLLNAKDAIENDSGEIRVITQRIGNEVHIVIGDNGRGIPPERIKHIFEPFYTTKAPGHGTGLGLSVCHQIISQHGGHIEVNSRVGEGTEFIVVLPIS